EWLCYINELSRKNVQTPNTVKHKALVFIELNYRALTNHLLVLSFGGGISYIEDSLIVKDFGFTVSRKLLELDKIENINSVLLGNKFLNSRRQSGSFIPASRLIEADSYTMVKDVTGKTDRGFWIGGNSPVIFKGKLDLKKDLIPLIDSFMANYFSSSPDSLSFDNTLQKVSNTDTITKLNEKLTDKILRVKNTYSLNKALNGSDLVNLDFATEMIKDPDRFIGYYIGGVKYKSSVPELDKEDYFSRLSKHLITKKITAANKNLIIEKIKRDRLEAVYEDDEEESLGSVFNNLFFETKFESQKYVLLSGKWFVIDEEFYKTLRDDMDAIPEYNAELDFFQYDKSVHPREENYNKYIAEENDNVDCLDQVFHTLPPHIKKTYDFNAHGKMEPCDLLTSPKRGTYHFIHVKKGKNASDMSHLFAQGYASAKLLMGDKRLIEHINNNITSNPKIDENILPNDIEVVFAMTLPENQMKLKNSKTFTLLSMLTIVSYIKRLSLLGFRYSIQKILDVSP
ncbi:DUF6119 family protein, partial [Priestia aryabhattai]